MASKHDTLKQRAANPKGGAPSFLNKSGKKPRDLESFRDISDDVIESDFLPYACLFDPSTIATKDGELLQIIKITGLGFDAKIQGDLRAAIRRTIKEYIPNTDYAIWLTTLRRKQVLTGHAHFADKFSGQLDEAWRASHPISASYVNELYITLVKAGDASSLRSLKTIAQSLWPPRDTAIREQQLATALGELCATSAKLLAQWKPFGARMLTTVERGGVFYGEHLEFLEKLINLEERPMELPLRDLSQVLTSGEITFGHNAMEVRTADGHRRFAAILSLKEYKESTLAGIDQFLEIPCELIVSQCFDFIGAKQARESYEKQARYLGMSGDKELAKWMEIDRLMQDHTATEKAFGQQQTSIFLIGPTLAQVEGNVKMVQRSLSRLGMVVVREDLRFEECYWSQLPANFSFIARNKSIDTDHLAGFANLQAAPMGNAAGSPWGPPVSLFTTLQDAPYFFNFHSNGAPNQGAHSIILGRPNTGRTTLTHFLLAQARKLPVSIWYVDAHGRSAPAISAMGGTTVTPGSASCKLNPFHLPETTANRDFLALWVSTLIDPYGAQLTQSSFAFFQSLIDQMLALPRAARRLSALLPIVREADGVLANSLQRFCAGGQYGELFDMPEDQFKPAPLISWDISRWMNDPNASIPLAGYLLHRLTGALDGKPTLIVLDEGFRLLNTPLFAPRAANWLDYLTQNNAAAILTTDAIVDSGSTMFSAAVSARAATIFAMPDSHVESEYMTGFGLTDTEVSSLNYIDARQRQVFMKRGTEGLVLKMNLAGLNATTLATLSGRPATPAPTAADTLAALMSGKAIA